MVSVANKENSRYDWLDLCKGIGIILVVLGHAIITPIREKDPIWEFIYRLIYYFHMPFMMFLSGVAYEKFTNKSSKKKCIYKKIRRVLIPYISYTILVEIVVVALILFPPTASIFGDRGYTLESPSAFLIHLLIGANTYTTHLWYIYTLFIFYIWYIFTENVFNKRIHIILGIILFTIKCIVNTDEYYIINDICTLYIWFALGVNTNIFGNLQESLKVSLVRRSLILAGLVYFSSDILYIPTPGIPPLYALHTLIKFMIIYIVIISIIVECMNLKKTNSVLRSIGQKSFSIYLFHQPFACVGIVSLLYGKVMDCIAVFVGMLTSFLLSLLIDKLLDFKQMKYMRLLLKG